MMGTDAIIDERKAISDLRTACAEFRSKLQDIHCAISTQSNRADVSALLNALADHLPNFAAMVECLEENKNG